MLNPLMTEVLGFIFSISLCCAYRQDGGNTYVGFTSIGSLEDIHCYLYLIINTSCSSVEEIAEKYYLLLSTKLQELPMLQALAC